MKKGIARDSIVWDGVTFVPEGEVVTLKSKGTGAMHWAAQPAYLNVTNNKFYMPDEVVSVKASALPLEATPTIQVDGEKLTGFTAGEYYSYLRRYFPSHRNYPAHSPGVVWHHGIHRQAWGWICHRRQLCPSVSDSLPVRWYSDASQSRWWHRLEA